MYLKKRLGKYRNSEQQFNTCSALSCIYWTFDVIISSAVFFSQCLRAYMPWFHSGVWKKCKSRSSDFIIYEEEEKNSYLDRSVARFMVGKGSWKPVWAKKPLSSITNTIYTLWPNRTKLDQKTWTNSSSPTGGICDSWGHITHTHMHTHKHTCVSRRPDHPGRQDGKAGPSGRDAGKNERDRVKLAAGQEIWNDWFTRGNSVCAMFVSRLPFPHSAIAHSDLPTNPPRLVFMLFSLDTVVSVCVSAFCLNECNS